MQYVEDDSEPLWPGVTEFLEFAENLKSRCQKLDAIHGIGKLERKIKSEMKFLNQLKRQGPSAQRSQLNSSNLSQLSSVVHAAERLPNVTHVIRRFAKEDREEGVLVDVVAGGGYMWFKIIARKAEALHCIWAGQGQFGERDPVAQAEEFLECAQCHPHMFTVPQVHLAFYNNVTEPMAQALTDMGIAVWGARVPVRPELEQLLASHMAHLQDDEDEDDDSYDDNSLSKSNVDDSSSLFVLKQRLDSGSVKGTEREGKTISSDPSTKQPDSTLYQQNPHENGNCCMNDEVSCDVPQRGGKCTQCLSVPVASSTSASGAASTTASLVNCMCHNACPSSVKQHSLCKEDEHTPDGTVACNNSLLSQAAIGRSSGADNSGLTSVSSGAYRNHANEDSARDDSLRQKIDENINDVTAVFQMIVLSPPEFKGAQTSLSTSLGKAEAAVVRVNLDVTCLITLVSALSHGSCHKEFQEKVLKRQAQEEKQDPVLPPLQAFLQGKELFTCKSAATCFKDLVSLMGGPGEKARAKELMSAVHVVDDQTSARAKELICGGKVKVRSKVIFGTGDTLEAITVTSNHGFVRAAQNQGVVFPAFLHSARALTELKEPQELSDSSSKVHDDVTALDTVLS